MQLECDAMGPERHSWLLGHGIPEWSGLEGTSVGHLVQPPAEAGSPRAGCTGPRPGDTQRRKT